MYSCRQAKKNRMNRHNKSCYRTNVILFLWKYLLKYIEQTYRSDCSHYHIRILEPHGIRHIKELSQHSYKNKSVTDMTENKSAFKCIKQNSIRIICNSIHLCIIKLCIRPLVCSEHINSYDNAHHKNNCRADHCRTRFSNLFQLERTYKRNSKQNRENNGIDYITSMHKL